MNNSILCLLFLFVYLGCPQCCTRFEGWKCVECPANTRPYRGHCLFTIPFCSNYENGFDCVQCESGYELNDEGECDKIVVQDREEIIDPNNLSGDTGNAFQIADDLLRSLHPELRNANLVGAKRIYKSDSPDHMVIQYQTNQLYYQGILEFDLQTFIFSEISYGRISEPTISPIAPSPQQVSEIPFNQNNPDHVAILDSLRELVKNTNPTIQTAIGAKIVNYSDNSRRIVAIFTDNQNKNHKVSGSIINLRVEKLISLSSTTETGNQAGYGPYIVVDDLVFQQISISSLNQNQNYLIVKDFIEEQLNGYRSLTPNTVEEAKKSDLIFYRINYTKENKSTWEVQAKINIKSLTVEIISEELTGDAADPEYQEVAENQRFKDFYFLVVWEEVGKNFNQYNTDNLQKVLKKEDDTEIFYRISFLVNAQTQQIDATISKITFAVQIITDPQPEPQPEPQPQPQNNLDTFPISQVVQLQIGGYTRVSQQEFDNTASLQEINQLLININSFSLTQQHLVLVFKRQQSIFSSFYKFFYLRDFILYEAYVSETLIPPRKNVISFGRL